MFEIKLRDYVHGSCNPHADCSEITFVLAQGDVECLNLRLQFPSNQLLMDEIATIESGVNIVINTIKSIDEKRNKLSGRYGNPFTLKPIDVFAEVKSIVSKKMNLEVQ